MRCTRYHTGMTDTRWPIVLFDLDGTLVDTVDLIISSFQYTWREAFGADLDPDLARSWIGRPLKDIFAPYGSGKSQELHELYVSHNLTELPSRQRRYDGIPELLDALRASGAIVGIVTSKRRETARMSLDAAGINGIELLAAMQDTTEHKPKPAPLQYALNLLGRRADEAVYVGDAVVDVQAARNAGTASVAVTWGAGTPTALAAEQPDAIVHQVTELLSVLTK